MSIRCLFGFHSLEETGRTFFGFYKFLKCNRCGARFQEANGMLTRIAETRHD
jgi:hypothetical protein